MKEKQDIVKRSFLFCGITNSLDGNENHFIRCVRELGIQLPYLCESEDDPFQDDDEDSKSSDEETSCDEEDCEGEELDVDDSLEEIIISD